MKKIKQYEGKTSRIYMGGYYEKVQKSRRSEQEIQELFYS